MVDAALASGGMAIIGAGLVMLSSLPARPSFPGWWVTSLWSDGLAAFSSPNTSAVMGSVPRAQLGVASGTLGTVRFLGQALSIGVLGALATSRLGAGGQAVLFTGGSPGARVRHQPMWLATTWRCWSAQGSLSLARSPLLHGRATAKS